MDASVKVLLSPSWSCAVLTEPGSQNTFSLSTVPVLWVWF